MHFAFLLYKFFPYGGMQRDFLRFAEESHQLGHRIRVYCIFWEGEVPSYLELRKVPVKAWRNHRRNEKYYRWVLADLQQDPVDGVVGFNKMPGLDVYYAADSCYLDKSLKERGSLYRRGGRFRHFRDYENAVFGPTSSSEILLISETEKKKFVEHYHTSEMRMHMLPPGISMDRRAPHNSEEVRQRVRTKLNLDDGHMLMLFIGSGFIKKGLARVIRAIADLQNERQASCILMVIGQDKNARYRNLAKKMGIGENVQFLGGRDDIPELLLAADMMIHPALDEAAGIVLLEAIVAGLPVVVTDVCGYAHHIGRADAGEVLASPFSQAALNRAVKDSFNIDRRRQWQKNALKYAEQEDLHSMHETGAKIIEGIIRNKQRVGP